ncbi:MAG TPA: hypothetical protein VF797_08335 [Noviherbaspirillum sp.]
MTRQSMSSGTGANEAAKVPAKDLAARPVSELVARLYGDAPPAEKSRLLEPLLRPLGLLALFALADGAFARIWLRNGASELRVSPDDAQAISADQIADLVRYLEQASVGALDGLCQVIGASPLLAGSASAVLVVLVLRRLRSRRFV